MPLNRALREAGAALQDLPLPPEMAARVQRAWSACSPATGDAPASLPSALAPAALPVSSPLGGGGAAGLRWWSQGLGWVGTLGVVGLALWMVVGWYGARLPVSSQPSAAAAVSWGSGFLPVVSSQRLLEAMDAGPTWLVPGEWPRERLVAFGLPFDPARAGESVRAELLVHDSGDVLAVRLLAR